MSFDDNPSNKRARASGEVLDYLLQEFEHNHNPSPEQRKEISDRTSMSEKAVRIWFQNRRAKLRKLERMGKNSIGGGGGGGGTSSIHSSRSNSISINDSSRPNSLLYNFNLIPIEINEKYCLVDCLSLSVGSWQRIKTGFHDESLLKLSLLNLSPFTLNTVMSNVDLLVILSKKNLELNYFFLAILNNCKILFRIFYPILSIITCLLLDNNINKENSELRVSLSHQPKFLVYFFNGAHAESNQWSICDDFSEGQQVLQAYCNEGGSSIPHVLVGVKNSLKFLNAYILENNQLGHLHQNPQQILQQQMQQHQQHQQLYNPHDQQSGPEFIPFDDDGVNAVGEHDFQFKTDANIDWDNGKFNNFSPLGGGMDSETSPNSITSNNSAGNIHVGPLIPNNQQQNMHNNTNHNKSEEGDRPKDGNDTPNGANGSHNNNHHNSHSNSNSNNSNNSSNGTNGHGVVGQNSVHPTHNNKGSNVSGNNSSNIHHPNNSNNKEFTLNSPDFFNGGQTPGLASSLNPNEPVTESLIHSPSTNLQAYTHQNHSPYGAADLKHSYTGVVGQEGEHDMSTEPFIDLNGLGDTPGGASISINPMKEGANGTESGHPAGAGQPELAQQANQQDFEFTLSNDFIAQTPGSEANYAASHNNQHVDSFIDYNSHYP